MTSKSFAQQNPPRAGDWNWVAIAYLVGMPLGALILFPAALASHAFTLWTVAYAVLHFSVDCLCVTVGYHRLFSHRSYKAHPIVEWAILILGAGSFQNSALIWASDHRVHHRVVDTDADPYSIRKGFWWAHVLWMFHNDAAKLNGQYPADLKNSRAVQLQDRFYLPLAFLVGWGIPLLVGALTGHLFAFFYVGVVLRLLASGHCTFFINSLAHMVGTRPFCRTNTARDNWFLSILTFGEGYHNFHHKFQADYRNGIQWYSLDASKWIIFTLSKLGLCSDLIRVPEEKIHLARMEVEEQVLAEKGLNVDALTRLRTEIELVSEKIAAFRRERNQASRQSPDLKQAFHELARQWKEQRRDLPMGDLAGMSSK